MRSNRSQHSKSLILCQIKSSDFIVTKRIFSTEHSLKENVGTYGNNFHFPGAWVAHPSLKYSRFALTLASRIHAAVQWLRHYMRTHRSVSAYTCSNQMKLNCCRASRRRRFRLSRHSLYSYYIYSAWWRSRNHPRAPFSIATVSAYMREWEREKLKLTL